MPAIKHALETKNYNACVSIITKLDVLDDELNYLLALCFFELGVNNAKIGALDSAYKSLELCLSYCKRTLYDTRRFEAAAPLYIAVTRNISAPLLEFDTQKYESEFGNAMEYEFYKYLILDFNFDFTQYQFKRHMDAKAMIRDRKYQDAVDILSEIEQTKSNYEYNAYVIYSVYSDLELCYKQLFQFENAYRYSSKRLSLLEGFNQ